MAFGKNSHKIAPEIEIYVNFGSNPAMPTKSSHENIRWINSGEGKTMVIKRNKNLKAGSKIAVLLAMGPNSHVIFSSMINHFNSYNLTLNSGVSDFIPSNSSISNLYSLNLQKLEEIDEPLSL